MKKSIMMQTQSEEQKKVFDIVENLQKEVPGILSIAVVDPGSCFAREAPVSDEIGNRKASNAHDLKILSSMQAVLDAMQLHDEKIEESAGITKNCVHILKPVLQGRFYLSVLIDSNISNLAWTRQILSTCG